MVDEGLVKKLLKALEAERGCPVQLSVETPSSLKAESEESERRDYFGELAARPVTVRRIRRLSKGYDHDLELIEGDHESFRRLQGKIKKYNILFALDGFLDGFDSPDFLRVLNTLRRVTDYGGLAPPLYFLFKKSCPWGISQASMDEILQEEGIDYFRNHLEARHWGLYHLGPGGNGGFFDKKIADVTFRLVD